MTSSDHLAEKTLGWTRWQTWLAAVGLLLAIVLAWSTLKGLWVATWFWITVGIRIPVWLILLMSGGVIWAVRRRGGSPVPSVPPVEAPRPPTRPEEATVEGVLWRWSSQDLHGRIGKLKAFCPQCDLELEWQETRGAYIAADNWTTMLVCLRCSKVLSTAETHAYHLKDIIRKIIEAGLRQEEAGRG